MKLDVLGIGAHPDDLELSCGGTLAKLVKQGRRVGLVDLTEGELGTRGSREIRAQEAETAARILGIAVRENLRIADGNIENTPEQRLRLARVIRKYRPDILLIPFHTDRHPDHERAHVLAREAWFAAGLPKIGTLEEGHPQEAHRPRAYYCYMQWHEFPPSFIVDVSETMEIRKQAMKAFVSQFYDPASQEPQTVLSTPEFLEMMHTRISYYGQRIGVRFGEPFYSPAPLRVNDLMAVNT
jgi:bacillithiol biosynthesis deacetylase BshB1